MVDRDPVEILAEEFAKRFRAGEQPSIEEYAERYPEYADQVLRTFPALVLMENLAANDQEASGSVAHHVDPSNEAASGMVLGDFRIIREVGRGGMGVVYEAEQVSLARHVALKLLPKQVWRDPKQKKRFEREVRAAAQLHHTNIVPVFGAGEQDGFHYYVMQFIEGLSLAQVLDELKRVRDGQARAVEPASELARSFAGNAESTGSAPSASVSLHWTDKPPHSTDASRPRPQPDAERRDSDPDDARTTPETDRIATIDDTATTRLSDTSAYSIRSVLNARRTATRGADRDYWQSVARIGIQVAEALEHAHGQGICHRDIKPANLLLDTRGTVWITDFGLAKADEHEDVTNTGDIIGTLRYIAPEAFDGPADYRSDLYGLGLTLYELVALRAAFDETERNRLMRQVMEAHPTRLKTLNPAIPRDLETIIAKAMDRDPLRRYQSAGELAADLHRFLRDEPIQARRIGRFERVWRWCRRNPGVSWTTAVASLLLIATVATAFLLVTDQRDKALQLARDKQQQAERLAVLAEEKARLAEQEQQAKDSAQAALTREEGLRKREAELRQVAETARDRADQAAKESQTVTNFLLLEMYGAASTGRTHGEELTVRSLLDWSAERADRLFTAQPLQEAAVRDAIGQAYQRLGLFDRARQQLEQALDIRQRILGHDHATTLATTNALALVLYHQGRYTESHDLCTEALPILRQTVGTEHPTTLSLMNTLAMSLHGLRRYAEAQTLCEEALTIQRRTLGPEHPNTLATMNTLAMARHSQKDYVGARKILNESMETLQRQYGPDHANTLSAMANLAASIYGEGDYEAAQQAYAKCWEAMKRVIGPEHPTTLAIQENLAVTMMYQKKYTEAEPLLRQALDLRKQSHGTSDWRTANAASQLAACLTQQGQYDESERLLLESYDRLTANTDTPPEFVRLTMRRLLILYRDWKRPDDMKVWRAKLVQFNATAPH